MSEVIERKLSDIGCEFISGFGFKSSDYINTGIPLIKIGNIQNRIVSVDINGTYIPENIVNDKIKQVFLSNNDVLIAMTGQGSVGRVGRLKLRNNDKALLNQRVGKFVCDEKNINVDYLYYILTSDKYQDYLFNTGAGSGQPNLSPDLILQTEIPWCEYTEQKAIAEVLSSLDDKIDLLHRQNKTLEQMAETLFRQWFVEEAGEDWGDGVLGDLVEVKYGKDHKKLQDGAIPVYGSGGVMRFAEKSLYDNESVLIPRKGTLNNVVYIDKPFWTVDTMFYTIMKKLNIAKFIHQFMKGKDLVSMNVGSAVPSMTTQVLNSMPLLIPSDKEFEYFENAVIPYYQKTKQNQTQIHTLKSLRDTLLPKLMSGEVRIAHNG